MTRLVLATDNSGKIAEFREALAGSALRLITAREAKVLPLPVESAASYEENALLKAGHAAARSGLPSLADDSGLEVDALAGEPGVHSARFGGNLSAGERIAHLLSKLKHVPEEKRGARFVCALVMATPRGHVATFYGVSAGLILQGPRGAQGFGYDPVFYSFELGKSFAEATAQEKRRVSHRGRALQQLLAWLARPESRRLLAEGSSAGRDGGE